MPPVAKWPVLPMLLAALVAAAIHLLPFWVAQRNTPDGYRFTGVLSGNPDMMQYQVWMREAARTGPIIRNTLTSEPNRPYLPVPFYWALGTAARITGVSPDILYRVLGAVFAAAFAAIVYLVIWRIFPNSYQRWWTYAVFLVGGTLTAVIKLVMLNTPLSGMRMARYIFFAGQDSIPGLEGSRSVFALKMIFDSHYLLLWLLVMGSVAACYLLVERWTPGRLLAVLLVLPLTVFVNIHLIVLLTAIFASTGLLLYARGLLDRRRVAALLVCWLPAVAVAAAVARLERHSGLTFPTWRTGATPLSLVLMGYPLAFLALGWGLRNYWQRAGIRECVLLGWIMGCLLITMSGPFYPFPHRGLLTLQFPLILVAASIYFHAHPRLSRPVMAAVVLLMIPMILVMTPRRIKATRFDPADAFSWLSPAHERVIARLTQQAGPKDVLLAPFSTRLWLVPHYPGVLYVAHGFLTVDFPTKEYRLGRFLADSMPARQAEFLAGTGVRFVFVPSNKDPARFAAVPGLAPLEESAVGTLFEFTGGVGPRPTRLPYEPDAEISTLLNDD